MFVALCVACIAGALIVRVALWNGVVPELENIFSAAMLLPARVDSLTAGALLAALALSSGGLSRFARFGLPALVAATAGISVIFIARDGFVLFDEWVQTAGFSLTALFGAALLLLIAASAATSRLASAFAHPVLRMFGRYSYAMYVVHLQIAFVIVRRLEGADWPLVFGSEVPMRVLFTLMGLAIVTFVGWLSWNLYEKHFLRLKRFFSYEHAPDAPVEGRAGIAKPVRAEGGS
jgi:peptidoglycan/LPS O-acetylase OafA/YrhL